MQIIFDEKLVPNLKQRYVVLELDTVMQPDMTAPITLHALIENIEIDKLPNLINMIQQHEAMVKFYKNSDWDKAIFDAYAMKGQWHGEIDEFYDLVIQTSEENKKSKSIWTGIRYTTPID
jgi:hypothetical protein